MGSNKRVQYTHYRDLLLFVDKIGLGQNTSRDSVLKDLDRCSTLLNEYKEYLVHGNN